MLKKEDLEQYNSMAQEIDDLEKRIDKINTEQKIVEDSVTGSAKDFPYTLQHIHIRGYDESRLLRKKKQYKKMLIKKRNELIDKKINIEYEIERLEDCELATILRMRYFDNAKWTKIQTKLGYNSEDTVKSIVRRFFEKN